jgi:hypothetical protein
MAHPANQTVTKYGAVSSGGCRGSADVESVMENVPHPSPVSPKEKRSLINSILVGFVGVISAVYIFNPTAGFIELIPDNIPIIGNLDEAAAAALLISALAYFGIDIGRLFGKASGVEKRPKGDLKSKTTVDADFVDR